MATVRFSGNFLDGKTDVFSVADGTSVEQIIREHSTGDEFSGVMVECYDCDTGKTFYAPLEDEHGTTNAVVSVNSGQADLSYKTKENDVVEIIITPAGSKVGTVFTMAVLGTMGALIGFAVAGPFGATVGLTLGLASGYALTTDTSTSSTNTTSDSSLSSSALPDVRGSANQPLTGNPIPAVIGKHLATPFIVGSPWNEITGDHGDENYIHCLYAVGYAPLRITDIKLGDMYLAHNQPWNGNEDLDCVFTGTLYGTDGNDGEIVNTWSSNDISIEILQQHQDSAFDVNYGEIYPEAKIQQDIDANVLYILDNALEENDTVSYRGAGLENGLRNNVIRFTEQYPFEIQVELNFSQGLYKSYTKGTKSTSYTKYEKIPLWVAIQWRVYSEDNDAADGNESGVFDIPSYDTETKSYADSDGKKKRPWVSFDTINSTVSASSYTQSDNTSDMNAHTGNHLDNDVYNEDWIGAKVFNLQSLGFSKGAEDAENQDGLDEFRCVTSVNLYDWAKENLFEDGDSDETFIDKFRSYFYDATNTAKSIEVRLVRLSPNYIDETTSYSSGSNTTGAASFSDLFTWKTLTTTIMDSDKLKGSGTIEAKKPLNEEKMRKMCLIAVKAKTDTTDQIGNSLKKLTCTAQSFSPYYDSETGQWVPENVLKTTRYCKPSWTDSTGTIQPGIEITKTQYESDRQSGIKSLKFSDGNDFTKNIVENVIFTDSHYKIASAAGSSDDAIDLELSFRWSYGNSGNDYYLKNGFIKAEWDTSKVSQVELSGTFTLGETSLDETLDLVFTESGEEKTISMPSTDITESYEYEEEITEIVCGYEEGTGKYKTKTGYTYPSFLYFDSDFTANIGMTEGESATFSISKTVKATASGSVVFCTKNFLTAGRYVIPSDDGTLKYCGNNVASMFLLAGIGAHVGREALGYTQSDYDENGTGDFDLHSLSEWYEWAEDVTDGSTYNSDGYHYEHDGSYTQHSKGDTVHMYFTANAYLYKSQQLSAALSKIAIAGRSVYIRDHMNRIKVITDKKEPYPVAMITAQNTLKSSGTLSYSELPSGFQIPYNDEDDGYAQNTIYCMNDGEDASAPRGDIEQYSLDYVTNNYQAWSLGRYILANRLLNREVITKQIGPEGASIEFGDVVLVQDDNMLIGTDNGGRISELIEDSSYIYGFLVNNTYEYTGETTDDGEHCKKGVMVMQPSNYDSSRIITARLAKSGTKLLVGDETYELSKGNTNLVILESPISKSGDTSDGGEFYAYKPAAGNLVAFGEVGKITEPYRVTNVKEDEKHNFTFTLIKYTEELYSYGRELPTFQNSMTVPDRSGEDAVILEEKDLTADELKNTKTELEIKIEQTEDSILNSETAPEAPTVSASAGRDGIEITCAPQGSSLSNTIKSYTAVLYKGESDSEGTTLTSASSSFSYTFDRSTDGYPEADALALWSVKAKAVSIYGIESEWTEAVTVDTSAYGTWELQNPNISTRVSARTITLMISEPERSDGRTVYGTVSYRVQVKRPDTDTAYFKPAASLDPYGAETNYKDGEGYAVTSGTYIQTMPLKGQSSDNITDTAYMFRVCAASEASVSGWTETTATAVCTDIRDIVKANETAKEAYISSLSAISANLGVISQGSLSGSDTNYWALSTVTDEKTGVKRYEGAMRVGGDDEYIKVIPVVSDAGVITNYRLEFKAGKFEITTEATNINGEMTLQTDTSSLDRTRITPTGTYYEHRESVDSEWFEIAHVNTDGILTSQVYSTSSLVLTNEDIVSRRKNRTDIGIPYLSDSSRVFHFDTDLYDQDGSEALTVSGSSALVGAESETSDIDFTPAILAVSPYSTVAKSLFGKYALTASFGNAEKFTVDFWLQYIYSENQTLFEIGDDDDKISLKVVNSEYFYEKGSSDESGMSYNKEAMESRTLQQVEKKEVFAISPDEDVPYCPTGYEQATERKYSANMSYFTLGSDGEYTLTAVTRSKYDALVLEGLWFVSVPYNTPADGKVYVEHAGQTESEREEISSGLLADRTWIHIAITCDSSTLKILAGSYSHEFTRYASHNIALNISMNPEKNSFLLDELMVDTATVESGNDFSAHTLSRIPWGALDKENDNFVLTAKDTANIKTNLFDTDAFKEKVLEIINEYHSES